MPKSRGAITVLWIVIFCLVATVFAQAINAPQLLLLKIRSAVSVGQVTRLHPENHGTVDVRYEVAGATYEGLFFPGRAVAPGDIVPVYYSPRYPTVASITPPGEILATELPFLLVLALLVSALMAAAIVAQGPNTPLGFLIGLLSLAKIKRKGA